jgi:hypothetical protein
MRNPEGGVLCPYIQSTVLVVVVFCTTIPFAFRHKDNKLKISKHQNSADLLATPLDANRIRCALSAFAYPMWYV